MRILMLSPYIPWPLRGGGATRIYHILKALARRGHSVVLLAGAENQVMPTDDNLKSICEDLLFYKLPPGTRRKLLFRHLVSALPYPAAKYVNGELRVKLRNLLDGQRFDLVWVNTPFLVDALDSSSVRNVAVVLDEHESLDLVWNGYVQRGTLVERLFALTNLVKIKRFEKRLLPTLDAVLCVSEVEAVNMRRRVSHRVEVWTVPNGVDVEFFQPTPLSRRETNRIMLCANMGVGRNIEAAVWFVTSIFPRVRAAIPEAEFWIVGADPRREVQELERVPGVHVTGSVEDIRDYYAQARVSVAPYHFGAGTKLKILEAMACGTPVVSTFVGCQGIDVNDGEHVLMAKTEAEFSDRVIELMSNPQQAQALAVAGRALMEKTYRWEEIVGRLEPMLQKLVEQQEANRLLPHFAVKRQQLAP